MEEQEEEPLLVSTVFPKRIWREGEIHLQYPSIRRF